LQLKRRIVANPKQRERRDNRPASGKLDRKVAGKPRGSPPIAGGERGINPSERIGMIRLYEAGAVIVF
jgi:hypothetical protein